MYDQCYNEIVVTGVAIKLKEPVWMDRDGVECEEAQDYFCKVTHVVDHPEYCLVDDEVGGNTNQKGNGHVGERSFL